MPFSQEGRGAALSYWALSAPVSNWMAPPYNIRPEKRQREERTPGAAEVRLEEAELMEGQCEGRCVEGADLMG